MRVIIIKWARFFCITPWARAVCRTFRRVQGHWLQFPLLPPQSLHPIPPNHPPKSSPGCPLSLLSSFHCTIIRHLPHFLVTTTFREVSIGMQYFVWTQLNDPKIGKDRYRVCQTKVTVEAKMITSEDAPRPPGTFSTLRATTARLSL